MKKTVIYEIVYKTLNTNFYSDETYYTKTLKEAKSFRSNLLRVWGKFGFRKEYAKIYKTTTWKELIED